MAMPGKFMGWDQPGKALITGASAGIGRCFARELAQKAFDLVLVARRKDRLESIAAELSSDYGVGSEVLAADLSNPEGIRGVADFIRQTDPLDILINNAGFATLGYFADIPLEKSMQMLCLHTTAPATLAHAALAGMLKRNRGAIINVASIAAFAPTTGNAMYGATKAYLTVFSENLQMEVKDAGIQIQALCPGFTHTEFHEVGDFINFNTNVIPAGMWMPADKVVSLSLKALESGKKTTFLPGWKNRLSIWLVQHSSLVCSLMQKNVKARERGMKAPDINQ